MREITQQQITAMAVNAAAVNNAKKICSSGKMVSRFRSEDDTFYMGECKGSGKSNYVVSVDYIDESQPVFRCSCPSRQFPCKHGIALLFEMEAKKDFPICEIPKDILDKRAKKEARETKKAEEAAQPPKEKKTNKSARTKKIKKQMEGLVMLEKMIGSLLDTGLGTMGGVSLKSYRDLVKQLGDYYLPGPLNLMNGLIWEIEEYQKDSDTYHYKNAIDILVRLRSLTKKANAYLQEKLDTDNADDDDSILYEKLGGIWTLERLNHMGLCKDNARLVQLSFEVYYDAARKEYIDLGYFMDVDSGEICAAYNYRPLKALKYIKEEDSVFDLVNVPRLSYYPGDMNKRIRWDKCTLEPLTDEIRKSIMEKAYKEIPLMIKQVKNQIKNTLSDDFVMAAIQFKQIGKLKKDDENDDENDDKTNNDEQNGNVQKNDVKKDDENKSDVYVLEDYAGNRITLKDKRGKEPTLENMVSLDVGALFENQVLFGMIYYDSTEHQIYMQPYSILTEKAIVRILY